MINLKYVKTGFDKIQVIQTNYNNGKATTGKEDFLNNLYNNLEFTLKVVQNEVDKIIILYPKDAEYQILKDFCSKNLDDTKGCIRLEFAEAFKLAHKTKIQSFEEKKDIKLLWFGARTSAYSGLLSKYKLYGLQERQKPFKAWNLTDSVTSASSLSYLDRYDKENLLVLCEADLGEIQELDSIEQSTEIKEGTNT